MRVNRREEKRRGRREVGTHKGILLIILEEGYFVWNFLKVGQFVKFSNFESKKKRSVLNQNFSTPFKKWHVPRAAQKVGEPIWVWFEKSSQLIWFEISSFWNKSN